MHIGWWILIGVLVAIFVLWLIFFYLIGSLFSFGVEVTKTAANELNKGNTATPLGFINKRRYY